jgi:hypothetical protein
MLVLPVQIFWLELVLDVNQIGRVEEMRLDEDIDL